MDPGVCCERPLIITPAWAMWPAQSGKVAMDGMLPKPARGAIRLASIVVVAVAILVIAYRLGSQVSLTMLLTYMLKVLALSVVVAAVAPIVLAFVQPES